MPYRRWIVLLIVMVSLTASPWRLPGQDVGGQPFEVPGQERSIDALNRMLALHLPQAFSDCTLWDGWLPHASLWTSAQARDRYRASLLRRRIDRQGYVSMQQHRGMAHSEGWPFPAWQQSTGRGWHFSTLGDVWAIQNFNLQPLSDLAGWQITGGQSRGIDQAHGLGVQVDEEILTLTTPEFQCGTIVAPFVRLEWATDDLPAGAGASLQWRLAGETDWTAERSATVELPANGAGMQYTNVPLYLQPGYAGLVKQYRIKIDNAPGARIDLKSLITAVDTRHPITGALFVRAICEYFAWTHDLEFLQTNLSRARRAMQYSLEEFGVREHAHVVVPWVGHDGRSGLEKTPDGATQMRVGLGVGNNYWDLLPFGGHDALATIYLVDAIDRLAALETAITEHPEWELAVSDERGSAGHLRELAQRIRADFQTRFWNPTTRRFVGWVDLAGKSYDYGFTFVNLEAIHYGLATPSQAEAILAWIDGDREVAADTSQGADIYHWRFAPRATTRRNVETYVWAWSNPAAIPWGGQVQDGGAVLGFSYFDLMARLQTKGPDDAWQRLQEILAWFGEVEQAGGYRAYYAVEGRGSLQGGGTAGGLGLDQEFMESVLVPQVMLYGFLGFRPTAESFEIDPKLPTGWPALTVRGIHIHDRVINVTAKANGEVIITDQ